ncbi:F-box DNA helicase 1-like [Chanos chanos]|uniref:F-box DNA helicase 1-like n=1 Tax=Chanos chanos TaxID=29144 RepID=A0A6J2V2R0_CHACN|nr:F-box DNA helicase 1-like [Chanos chanos]
MRRGSEELKCSSILCLYWCFALEIPLLRLALAELLASRSPDLKAASLALSRRKRYVRYQQQEHDVVEEVKSLLQQNHIVKENKQFLLNMVRFLSSQAVTPGSVCLQQVLVCVSGHRLYSQAEACIRHRIPDLLGTDGAPNPWSVIVLLLVLAGGVRDVLDLVVRLQWSGCPLNHAQVTELLWATATLLLAMTHSDCPVGNRLHYDVFYVLQLMENAPPRQTDENVSDLQMSQEQQHILNHDVQSDHVVKIMAFAGTGKTSTLLRYAQRRPKLHLLYVAFNKSVAEQARRTFPKNVHCRTIHSLAHESVGHRYQKAKKLRTRQKAYFVARVLPKGHGGFVNAKVVIRTIDMFCASVDQVIGVEHVPKEYKNTTGLMKTPTEAEKEKFVEIAKELWDKMVSLESVEDDTDAFYMTTDGYLKLWQLQKPQLENYDIILIDEAQDCTPAIMDIILSQRCGKILVGDPHQQIYTFRGAVNALYTVPHTHIYYLTQSFRFGSEIAYTGATILSFCKGVTKNLIGGSQGGSVRGENSSVLTGLKSGLGQGEGKVAVLCRKNITVFIQAATLVEANPDCRIYLIGGVADFALPKIMDVWRLMQPEYEVRKEIKDPFIKRFVREGGGDYESFRGYVTLSEDLELEYHLSVVEKYKQRIPHLIERIRNSAQRTQRQRHKADFILGTLHKSKGMEFDTVVIADDFSIVNMALQTSPRTGKLSEI